MPASRTDLELEPSGRRPHLHRARRPRHRRADGSAPPARSSSTSPRPTSSATPSRPPTCRAPTSATPYDMSVTGRDLRIVGRRLHRRSRRAASVRPSWMPGSASATSPPTSRSTPGCSPSSPVTCRSPRRCGPTPASARTGAPDAVDRHQRHRAVDPRGRPGRPTGCCTTTDRPSPADGMTHAECRVHDEDGATGGLLHRRRHGAWLRRPVEVRRRPDRAVSLTSARGPLSARPVGLVLAARAVRRRVRRAPPPTCAGVRRRPRRHRHRARAAGAPRRSTAVLRVPGRRGRRPAVRARAGRARVRPGAVGRRRRLARGRPRSSSTTRRTPTTASTADRRGVGSASRSPARCWSTPTTRSSCSRRRSPPCSTSPASHVRTDLLERTDTTSYCNYKGVATYWRREDRRHRRRGRRLELRGPARREHRHPGMPELRPRTGRRHRGAARLLTAADGPAICCASAQHHPPSRRPMDHRKRRQELGAGDRREPRPRARRLLRLVAGQGRARRRRAVRHRAARRDRHRRRRRAARAASPTAWSTTRCGRTPTSSFASSRPA